MSRVVVAVFTCLIASPAFCDGAATRPVVGVIRWDAWAGGPITEQVERTLAPREYRFRLPWFADVRADGSVRIDGNRQEVMDREIAFAADAGVDYWAFLTYPAKDSMSRSLDLYLKSARRRSVNFCLIVHNALGVPAAEWAAERDRLVGLLKEPGYQTVLGGRPLVFAFSPSSLARFEEFRAAAVGAGLNPYCVYMGWNPPADFKEQSAHGFDAVSAYAYASDAPTFGALVDAVERRYWDRAAAAGVPYVPLVTTGWDKRPRKEHPVSWERDAAYHRQAVFPATATPAEIADHLRRGLAFVREHPTVCPANAVIVYAWNEHDEGGWLCPTWTGSGVPDRSRVDAVRSVLKPR